MASSTQIKAKGLAAIGEIFYAWSRYVSGEDSLAQFLTSFGNNKDAASNVILWVMANFKDVDLTLD